MILWLNISTVVSFFLHERDKNKALIIFCTWSL